MMDLIQFLEIQEEESIKIMEEADTIFENDKTDHIINMKIKKIHMNKKDKLEQILKENHLASLLQNLVTINIKIIKDNLEKELKEMSSYMIIMILNK
jgi:hypothetical protein